jgi:hypothetical protein
MPFDGAHVSEKARILMDALELLRRDGWCKGTTQNVKGEHCILGALYEAYNCCDLCDLSLKSSNKRDVIIATYSHPRYGSSPISAFNDDPLTNFSDVERWFEGQIAAAI